MLILRAIVNSIIIVISLHVSTKTMAVLSSMSIDSIV